MAAVSFPGIGRKRDNELMAAVSFPGIGRQKDNELMAFS